MPDKTVSITLKLTAEFPEGTKVIDLQKVLHHALRAQLSAESVSTVGWYTAKGAYRGRTPQDG